MPQKGKRQMNKTASGTIALLATACSWTLPATDAQAGVELLSHRANYQLSLYRGSRNSDMQAVRGLLVMETREGCEGYVSNQELAFVADLNVGPSFNYSVRFSSWESAALDRLRFTVKSYSDGDVYEEFEGSAEIAKEGSQAVYKKPREEEIDLPGDTIFPTAHMQRLVESAQAGKLIVRSNVFDGSGPDALTSVTASIGHAQVISADRDLLGGQTSWPVSLAYFPLEGDSDLPDFEISFQMTPEGVLHDLVLDYGDFALAGELIEFETFDKPDCG